MEVNKKQLADIFGASIRTIQNWQEAQIASISQSVARFSSASGVEVDKVAEAFGKLTTEGNTNISGVTVVFRAGEQEQTPPEGFESSGSETVLGTEVKYDTPITRTITSANIDRLRFTFGVQALVETTSKGDRNPSEVRLLVQIQRNGGWVTEKDITIKGKTTSQYLASVVVDNLPPRPFNIRMRRMTPDSTTDQLQNKTLWSSYTEIIDVKQCYPNTALTEDDARPEALRRFELMVEEVVRNASAVAQNTAAAKKPAGDAGTSAREAATHATDAAGSARAASTSAGQAASSAQSASSSAGTASTKATEAEKSAAAAESSKSAAATSAGAAKKSETNAAASQQSAATSASTATTKASEAATSARDAAASKEAAKSSETNASSSASSAASSATAAGNSAKAAKTSETNARSSETAAGQSASAAAGSKTAAASSASAASTSAGQASASATAAGKSAESAASSASTATTKAGEATEQASAAARSASAAKTSETNAKASETSAESSKTAAASSASSAASSASSASASKDEATRQASAAKGSATTASTKATEAAGSATAASQSKTTAESAATRAEAAADRAEEIAGAVAMEDASLTTKGVVKLSSAVDSTSESLAATPKAVKAANDNANSRVPSNRKVNGKALTADITLTPKDIGTLNSVTMSFSGGAGWFKLATVTMPQASSIVYIALIGGAGYNVGSPHQAGISELVLRAGNGNPKGITGALWKRTAVGLTNFAWINTSGDTYDIYVEIGNYATSVNIHWDCTANASVSVYTSPTYSASKPSSVTYGVVYTMYSSHQKPTPSDIGAHTHSVAIGSHGHTITVNAAGNAENTVKNIAFNYIVRLA
ncbi:prophage tail fiber N-terminal domain-containing protein [Escherichia coli]|jgi:hypothetical protein|uniref:TipJ family phage tail tip protein n=3 Tax=Escherichia coli TaxID=562 RepID=UPI00157357EB|nr:prophage tail fiber N-terminal domain-containing protein [Escherichia coli]MCK2337491.1 prophage tail fiber N-terminal domain-containing protein [Escherichia coli]MCK2423333.1 prophage tail fiber N-terminal domain-containing protein [Escherichia coli]MCR1079579.1 prophage tail fiber N-terminal domain-containing protein [Escherichia coli]MCU6449785.1 prophage tail fiber N-terminal domain-containing protein [Escherichia coli]MCY6746265.1 prophage tail fiber N-terminal domain-containing protei